MVGYIRSANRLRSVIMWIIAAFLTLVGLGSLLFQPIVGDDLVFVTFGGMGITWSAGGFGELFSVWIREFIASNHVTPVNGLLYAIQISLISIVGDLGVPIAFLWGVSRVFWISLALLAASFATQKMILGIFPLQSRGRTPLVVVYLLVLGIFLAFMQMHGPWTYDPLLSYGVAAWATSALGFLYVGLLAKWWFQYDSSHDRTLWFAALVGVIGFLTYEMFLAFVAAGVLFFGIKAIAEYRIVRLGKFLKSFSIAVGLPIIVFAVTQYVRLQWPSWYEGTSFGYEAWILPVALAGVISALPLANGIPAQPYLVSVSPSMVEVAIHVLAVVFAAGISLFFLGKTQTSLRVLRPYGLVLSVTVVISVALFANVIFAVSSKYQLELGTKIGYVYLAYAPSLLSLCALVAILGVVIVRRFSRLGIFVVITVVVSVAAPQAWINAGVNRYMLQQWQWTTDVVNALDGSLPEASRCDIARQLERSALPVKQKLAIAEGVSAAYESRFSSVFCEIWRERPAPPNNLALKP